MYKALNKVRKMITKAYTEVILLQIVQDLQDRGLILGQDTDSVYISRTTAAQVEMYNLPILNLPSVSPDFSIFKSLV